MVRESNVRSLDNPPEELCLDEFLVELPPDDETLEEAPRSKTVRHSAVARTPRTLPPPRRAVLPPPLPEPGQVLANRFQVESVVGQSNQEIVVTALDLELAERVVLRYLSPQAATSPDLVRKFGFAARKAQVLRSRYAERVLDTGRLDSGSPYRVSQLPLGPNLTEVLQVRGALPMSEAIDLMLTACDAVAEAHSVRLIYQNLSPSHLFLCRDVDGSRFLRLVDFGAPNVSETSARSGHELALPGTSAMTHALPYTAPEQIRTPASVDHRADIWALGAILYELLAGRPAFEASTPLALLAMIAADEPTPLTQRRPAVPETLARTVHACLQKEPWTRPQTAADLITLLIPFATQHVRQAVSREGSTRAPSTLIGHPAPSGLAEWNNDRRYSFPPRNALPKKLVASSTFSPVTGSAFALGPNATLPRLRAQAALMDPYAVFEAQPPGSDLPAVVITRRDPPPTIAPPSSSSRRPGAPARNSVPGGVRPTLAAIAAPRTAGHFGWLVTGCLATGIAAAAMTTVAIRSFEEPSAASRPAGPEPRQGLLTATNSLGPAPFGASLAPALQPVPVAPPAQAAPRPAEPRSPDALRPTVRAAGVSQIKVVPARPARATPPSATSTADLFNDVE